MAVSVWEVGDASQTGADLRVKLCREVVLRERQLSNDKYHRKSSVIRFRGRKGTDHGVCVECEPTGNEGFCLDQRCQGTKLTVKTCFLFCMKNMDPPNSGSDYGKAGFRLGLKIRLRLRSSCKPI